MRRSSASWRSVTHERFCVSHILRQVWDDHVITKLGEDADLLQIDRLVLHELSGSQAARALAEAGREPMSRSQVFTVIVPVELPMEIDGFRTRDLERRPCAYVPSRSTPT